jgi:glutamine amidotransferase
MIATILDYGAGNLHSLAKAISSDGVVVRLESDPARAIETDLLVLPGVGAFAFAAARLSSTRDLMRRAVVGGLPTIGICLGMQLLFESSEEGSGAGLGVFAGSVTRLDATRLPHIGWNAIEVERGDREVDLRLSTAYFANSFACRPADASLVSAWATHEGDRFPAIVRRGGICGMQFHPEKSSAGGVALLRAIVDEVTS